MWQLVHAAHVIPRAHHIAYNPEAAGSLEQWYRIIKTQLQCQCRGGIMQCRGSVFPDAVNAVINQQYVVLFLLSHDLCVWRLRVEMGV